MAFITRKITRTSQPQDACEIDWSNPLNRDLIFADLPCGNGVIDATKKIKGGLTGSGVSSVTTAYGKSLDFVPTGNIVFDSGTNPLYNLSGELTLMALITPDYAPGGTHGQYVLGSGDRGATSSQGSVRLKGNISAFWVGSPIAEGATTLLSGGTYLVGFSRHGSTNAWNTVVYVNGVIDGSSSTASNPSVQQVFSLGTFGASTSYGLPFDGRIHAARIWKRALSSIEWKACYENPWQIFEPETETIWIPDGVSVTLPTLVQPASTTSAGAWTPTGAATLHEAIDEATPSDADYISVAAASTCELVLAESAFPTGNVSLAYRALSSTGNTLTVTLKQGATTIMTRTHALTGTATLYTQALTAGEVAAIVAGPITCTLTSS